MIEISLTLSVLPPSSSLSISDKVNTLLLNKTRTTTMTGEKVQQEKDGSRKLIMKKKQGKVVMPLNNTSKSNIGTI